MEQAIPQVELARWQTATLVASAIAAVELVLVVMLGIALLLPDRGDASESERAKPRPAAKPATPTAKVRRAKPKPALSRA